MSLDDWQYLLLLAGCLAVTLPLEIVLGARVYRAPARLGRTLLVTVPAFVLWDMIAASRGVWWFSPEYVVGWSLLGLPVEEWLFFLVVPICGLLTYEAVGRVLAAVRVRVPPRTRPSPGMPASRPEGRKQPEGREHA